MVVSGNLTEPGIKRRQIPVDGSGTDGRVQDKGGRRQMDQGGYRKDGVTQCGACQQGSNTVGSLMCGMAGGITTRG